MDREKGKAFNSMGTALIVGSRDTRPSIAPRAIKRGREKEDIRAINTTQGKEDLWGLENEVIKGRDSQGLVTTVANIAIRPQTAREKGRE